MRSAFIGIAFSLLFSGCYDPNSWHAKTYPVSGTITINGEKPEYAIIKLYFTQSPPDVHESKPWAFVKADGSFKLMTYKPDDGAPPGDYAVTVTWPEDIHSPGSQDRLAGAFNSIESAPLNFTVKKGKNTIPPIELSGVKLASPSKKKPASQQNSIPKPPMPGSSSKPPARK